MFSRAITILFSTLLTLSAFICEAQVNSTPERGTCGYYLFADSIKQCGKRGYLMRYGYKYCNFFIGSHFNKFSTDGQKWALDMGHCLQMKIYEMNDSLTCKELKKAARKSHLPCLLESGYLDIDKKDQGVYKRLGARNPLNWPAGLYYMRQLKKADKNR